MGGGCLRRDGRVLRTLQHVSTHEQVTDSSCPLPTEQLLRHREDEIRIFLQELSQQRFNEDEVITELQSLVTELSKLRLDNPPKVIELQPLSDLNREAIQRARGAQMNGVSHESIHVTFHDMTPSPETWV